jgi:glycosyltransferase involved in cell wall biosynthesis
VREIGATLEPWARPEIRAILAPEKFAPQRTMPALLTIGIPTYGRPRELGRLLDSIEGFGLQERIEVLVVDDHPEQPGADAVRRSTLAVSYLANGLNLGYPRSLIRLVEECRTPYLLLMADDELLLRSGVVRLLGFLVSERPDFVSTRWKKTSSLLPRYARKVRRTGPLDPREVLRAAGHAPGLVFAVDGIRPHLELLTERLAQGCAIATTYPQVLLLCQLLLAGGRALQLAQPVGLVGEARPSQIVDGAGRAYWSESSRQQQLVDLREFLLKHTPSDIREEILNGSTRIGEHRVRTAARWASRTPNARVT